MAAIEKPSNSEMLKRFESHVRLDDYCKTLMGSVEYEAFEQKNGMYTIVFYSNRVVTHKIKNCTYSAKMFMIPRIQKRNCFLSRIYLQFKIFG
jgi:hypothetical protein